MIIGLTGRIASGKGVVAEILKRIGFGYITLSQIVRDEAAKRGIEITRNNLQDLGNEIRQKEGSGALMKRALDIANPNRNYVIDGIRNPGEVQVLREHGNSYLIAVDAPRLVRYQRVLGRAKPSDPKNWEGFLKIDNRDAGENDPLGQQVIKCMDLADFKLANDKSIKDLEKQLSLVFEKIQDKLNSC